MLSNSKLGKKFVPYPHFIIYDFEALVRKRSWCRTQDLTIDCSHIPVSVTINDILTQVPIFIENHDPKLLLSEFVAELTQRPELISKEVWDKYPMDEGNSLPKQVRN